MNLNALTKAILIGAALLSFQANAQNAPIENKTLQISRTMSSGNLLTGSMSQNLFKTETYQAPYTVQVPYQTTETYTENIPYTVEVPYTDYVTEYRQEYRCRNVTRYRNECHNQQQCYNVPGTPGQCRTVRECGTNAHGQPICKDRQVCSGGSGPTQRCENRQVCQNVPYTDQQCGYEQVAYQTPVTRYRTETRYRQETRTRTVTKYRDEQRCCRPETRQVFDKQLQYQVAVHFPQNAALIGTESELLNINLISANANSVQLGLQSINTVFNYAIASQTISGASISVELIVVAKYDLNNAGPSSIQNLTMPFVKPPKRFQLSFKDTIISSRIMTTYKASLFDEDNNKIEEKMLTASADGSVSTIFDSVSDKKAKVKAAVQVIRSGIIVSNSQLGFDLSVVGHRP